MSSIKETAAQFFDACETGKGWDACEQFCHPDASFEYGYMRTLDVDPTGRHLLDHDGGDIYLSPLDSLRTAKP